MTVDTINPTAAALQPLALGNPTSEALAGLAQWVQAAHSAQQLVTPLVDTPFVPDSFRVKLDPRATLEERQAARQMAIANATAAVLQGITLGLDPLTALQQIYVVHGRPGMYTKIKVALAQSRGHEIWTEDLTDTRAVVAGRRKGSQDVQRVTITMEMARKAGWTSNPSKAYDKTPADMLWARAAGRVADRIAADVLMGIASVEDIEDEDASDRPAPATRTVRRATPPPALAAPASAGHPLATPQPRQDAPSGPPLPGEDEPPTPPVPASVSRSIDPATWRRINARFVELDVTGPGQTADRLAVISEITGRLITRGGELTTDEGQLVLDNLAGDAGRTVVDMALDRGPAQTAPEQSAEPAQDAIVGDADPDNDQDDVDPTTDADWPAVQSHSIPAHEGTPPLPGEQTW